MAPSELLFESAVQLADRIRRKQVSAVELLDAHIQRIDAVNPVLNAIVTPDFDRARRDARAADERLARGDAVGPLHGLPITIKDAINTADIRTVAGSRLFTANVPVADAPAVRLLRGAGAIVLGKTNVPECAMDWRTVNPVFGRTSNPWNVEYSPGGSSGGEAAAIAAGCSTGGLGSDLGGSVRVPAHVCGICGLRPTPGRVPASGWALPSGGPFSLAHAFGPLARTVEDVRMFFDVLAAFDPCDPVSVALPPPSHVEMAAKDLKVAACVDGGVPVTAETRAAVERTAQLLAECGADVATWTLPVVAEAPQIFFDWVMRPSLPPLAALYRGCEDAMGPLVRGLSRMIEPPSLDRFLDAWSSRDALRRSVLDRMQQRRVLVMPVSSTPALRHDHRGRLMADGRPVDYAVSFAYSEVASLAGLPAIAIPVSRTADGLPVGVQLVARPFEEPLLLSVAALVEQGLGGYQRPPM